jgi:hypothetical protein
VMLWQQHDNFTVELKKICKKYPQVDDGIDRVKRLLTTQFDPQSPEEVIAPGKIHRVRSDTIWTLWKVEVVVPKSGLKPSQWPRMWFAVSGGAITLLCIATHMENYDNNTIDRLALKRITDIF